MLSVNNLKDIGVKLILAFLSLIRIHLQTHTHTHTEAGTEKRQREMVEYIYIKDIHLFLYKTYLLV